jgi:hypothetical protein
MLLLTSNFHFYKKHTTQLFLKTSKIAIFGTPSTSVHPVEYFILWYIYCARKFSFLLNYMYSVIQRQVSFQLELQKENFHLMLVGI